MCDVDNDRRTKIKWRNDETKRKTIIEKPMKRKQDIRRWNKIKAISISENCNRIITKNLSRKEQKNEKNQVWLKEYHKINEIDEKELRKMSQQDIEKET